MKILYIDDDILNRLTVKKITENSYQVDAVETPEEFFDLAKSNTYDIYLIDINLSNPDIDGFGVLEKLKELGLKNNIAIAHTNYFGEDWEKRCLDEGFDFYLPKPFILSVFEDILKKH